MGDVISSHLDEAKREIITGEALCVGLFGACCCGVLARVRFYAAATHYQDILYHLGEMKSVILPDISVTGSFVECLNRLCCRYWCTVAVHVKVLWL